MKVLITRPQDTAQNLANYLAVHDIASICLPALEILPPSDPTSLQQVIKKISTANIIIFVSPTAVHELFKQFSRLVFQQALLLAQGEGTADALAEYETQPAIYPAQADSDGLLALPELKQVHNKRIIIFAGEQGKTLLTETLFQRGAQVTMAYTHRRGLPHYQAVTWEPSEIDICLTTSEQSLRNFKILIEQLHLSVLLEKPLVVINTAMQEQARQLGFKSAIILAIGASNEQLLEALQQFHQGMQHEPNR